MQTADVLDAMGGLVAQLKIYAAKLPPIVHLSAVPTGVKPKFEAIEEYEEIVSRFRSQSAGSGFKPRDVCPYTPRDSEPLVASYLTKK